MCSSYRTTYHMFFSLLDSLRVTFRDPLLFCYVTRMLYTFEFDFKYLIGFFIWRRKKEQRYKGVNLDVGGA